jgi:hypothetical protein
LCAKAKMCVCDVQISKLEYVEIPNFVMDGHISFVQTLNNYKVSQKDQFCCTPVSPNFRKRKC